MPPACCMIQTKHAGSARTELFIFPLSHINKVSGDGGRGGHRGTDQMRATTASLSSFKVPIAGRSATFARFQDVGIHAETHRAAGLAPLKAGVKKDSIEPFVSGYALHILRPGHDHGAN